MIEKKEKDQLFEQLFEHATESIIVTDETGNILFLNPATEKYFAYTRDELVGKPVELLIPKRFAHGHENHRKSFGQNPHARSMGEGLELYAIRKNGTEFPVEISLSPFRFDHTIYIIAFVIDVTRRKEMERSMHVQQEELKNLASKLTQMNEKLESRIQDRTHVLSEALIQLEVSRKELTEALEKEKELNELKSRFLSMASHEFRTPLTAILSSASLIQEYSLSDQQEKRMKHVNRIMSAVNNLNDILSDFLSISKIEEGKVLADYKPFNIKKLVWDLANDMKNIAKSGQELVYIHEGPEQVTLDPKLIRNILINLISNAIKFSSENKTIEVKTSAKPEIFKLIVKDHGIGIGEDDKKHLFERFFRGQNATNIQGTGLGLNIVANYVELMHGTIEMRSELEKGTEVEIHLPL